MSPTTSELVEPFDSQGERYREAFDLFLNHTDQKAKARDWLDRFVDTLPRHEVFIDAGAGEGATTAWVGRRFKRTIAIEPNAFLSERLAQSCPDAQLLDARILESAPEAPADFLLCSHVFYYLPDEAWDANLDRLRSWLAPGGSMAVVMQNADSDCMQMLHHFFGLRNSLTDLLDRFQSAPPDGFSAHIDTVPCHITTPDFDTAYRVAEFVVNALPDRGPLVQSDLASYVPDSFQQTGGHYRFSCTQDFLVISRAR